MKKNNLSIYICSIMLILSCQQQNITPAFNCWKDTRGLIDTALLNYRWLDQHGDTFNFKYIPSVTALDYTYFVKKGPGTSVSYCNILTSCGGEFADYSISDGFYGSVTLLGCSNYYLTINKMYMNVTSSIETYSIDSIHLTLGYPLNMIPLDTFKLRKVY